jgi:endonuclease/exonuclease/phosphatase family metal-dependent hydrolase
MKDQRFILFCILRTAYCLLFLNIAIPLTAQLKVMTYNILTGFDWEQDSARGVKFIEWINGKKPDILALQEMNGFTEEKLARFARRWGHEYSALLKTTGYPVALTSNKPIIVKERLIEGMWHGMLHCDTHGIDFFVVHLSPADWQFRKKEALAITEKIKETAEQTDKYIVLGDFNAHSPMDAEFNRKFPYQLERYRKGDDSEGKYKNLHYGEYDYSVLSVFLSLSLIDVCDRFVALYERTTCPTPLNVPRWLTAGEMEKTKHRIDYILVSPELAKKCTGAWIFNGPENYYLSDHYPVMAEFRDSGLGTED